MARKKYENIPGVMTDSTTIRTMQRMFAEPNGFASYGRVMWYLHRAILYGEEPQLSDSLEHIMFDQAIEFATKKAEEWDRKSNSIKGDKNPNKPKSEYDL